MKAWLFKETGSIDNLMFEDTKNVHPNKDELAIKVISSALNPVDYQVIESENPEWDYPHIPGVDLAGVVTSVGEEVEDFRVGDRVACHSSLSDDGAFAEQAVVTAEACTKIPENLHFDHAAAILCAGMTASRQLSKSSITYKNRPFLFMQEQVESAAMLSNWQKS